VKIDGKALALWTGVLIILFASLPLAKAVDNGQWGHIPPHIRKWFKELKEPGGTLCCDLTDGHQLEGDDISTKGSQWLFYAENAWWEVPRDRVLNNVGNPTGQAVVFYRVIHSYAGKSLSVYCFVPPGGV